MEDWPGLERLSREMLAEAEKRSADAGQTILLSSAHRAGAQAILGKALLEQGRAEEAASLLEEAVAHFRGNHTNLPFSELPVSRHWEAAECLARALEQAGDLQRAIELLEWAFARRNAHVVNGGLLLSRVQLAECAWQLAGALDPEDPVQAARRHEVLSRAAEILNDHAITSRLLPEEQELCTRLSQALNGGSKTL